MTTSWNTLPHTTVSSTARLLCVCGGVLLASGDLSQKFYTIGYCIVPCSWFIYTLPLPWAGFRHPFPLTHWLLCNFWSFLWTMYQTSARIKFYYIVSMEFLSCEILVPLFQEQSMMFSTINGKSPATAIQLMISENSEQRFCVKIAGFFLLCVHFSYCSKILLGEGWWCPQTPRP